MNRIFITKKLIKFEAIFKNKLVSSYADNNNKLIFIFNKKFKRKQLIRITLLN